MSTVRKDSAAISGDKLNVIQKVEPLLEAPPRPVPDWKKIMDGSLLESRFTRQVFKVEHLTRAGLIELVNRLYKDNEAEHGLIMHIEEVLGEEFKRHGLKPPEIDYSGYLDRHYAEEYGEDRDGNPIQAEPTRPEASATTGKVKLPKWAREIEAETMQYDRDCGITADDLGLDHLTPEGLRIFWARHMKEETEFKYQAQNQADLLCDVLDAHGIALPEYVTRYRNDPGSLYRGKVGK